MPSTETDLSAPVRPAPKEEPVAASPLWQVAKSRGKAFVDFQNDVTVSDVKLAAREGFRVPEHVKRYTTLGMATDQGKTSSLNGAAVLADATGRYVGAVGCTTFRPPYTPVAIGALAGHHRGHCHASADYRCSKEHTNPLECKARMVQEPHRSWARWH